jgi:Arc/MetJ family transcription regulator
MKTTIDLPDDLYRETKALAALSGRTVKDLITELVRERVERERSSDTARGWRSAFGKVPSRAAAKIQAVVDEEFSQVDLGQWE